MKINTKNILQNKFVLYLVFFLSLVSVFGYITTSNFQAVLLFVLISLLTNLIFKMWLIKDESLPQYKYDSGMLLMRIIKFVPDNLNKSPIIIDPL